MWVAPMVIPHTPVMVPDAAAEEEGATHGQNEAGYGLYTTGFRRESSQPGQACSSRVMDPRVGAWRALPEPHAPLPP